VLDGILSDGDYSLLRPADSDYSLLPPADGDYRYRKEKKTRKIFLLFSGQYFVMTNTTQYLFL
jgi:hypothetical protein